MKFYTLRDAPIARDDKVFKASPTRSGVALIIFLAVAVAFLVLAIRGGYNVNGVHLPKELDYVIAVMFGLFALIAFFSVRARLKPTNWLLRCNSSGILLKYRSYQNWRMPADDVQVVGFDYSEITWVRKVRERRTSPGLDNATKIEFLTCLELGLVNHDMSALEAKLDDERKRPWTFRVLAYPVEVRPGGIVRLYWKGFGGSGTTLDNALRCLSSFVTIADAVSAKIDFTHNPNDMPQDEDAKIRQLAKSGDKLGAIKLTREIYGCSLAEAKEFVEKL